MMSMLTMIMMIVMMMFVTSVHPMLYFFISFRENMEKSNSHEEPSREIIEYFEYFFTIGECRVVVWKQSTHKHLYAKNESNAYLSYHFMIFLKIRFLAYLLKYNSVLMLGRRILLKIRFAHGDSHQEMKSFESVSNKPFFKIYQKAISLTHENSLEEANQKFRDCLDEIALSNQNFLDHYSYILKRMAQNHRRLGQNKLAEQRLYELIKNKRNCEESTPALIYDDYNLLFKHLITYDLQKAAKLCKALLAKEKQDMPVSHVKIFNMNLGIAYLLAGNYEDAKSRLSKCLQADPQGKIKSYALNNLGLACWWHKNPIDNMKATDDTARNNEKIVRDFDKAKDLFCRSIRESEKFDKIEDEMRKFLLDQSLSLNVDKLQEKLVFESQQSVFPVFNLAQFFLANDPIQKAQIMYWYSRALALSEKYKKDLMFDRIYVQYALLNSYIKELEERLPILIDKNRYTQQFSQQGYYCKILAKILHSTHKSQQASEYEKRAILLEKVLPSWTPKLRYIAYDELDLS